MEPRSPWHPESGSYCNLPDATGTVALRVCYQDKVGGTGQGWLVPCPVNHWPLTECPRVQLTCREKPIQKLSANSLGSDARGIVTDQWHPSVLVNSFRNGWNQRKWGRSKPVEPSVPVVVREVVFSTAFRIPRKPWLHSFIIRARWVPLVEDGSCLAQ